MTVLQLLVKMIGPAGDLVALLQRGAAAAPDLAPQFNEWIVKLNGAVSQSNIIALAEVLPKEIANIAAGKIDPRRHPSDAA